MSYLLHGRIHTVKQPFHLLPHCHINAHQLDSSPHLSYEHLHLSFLQRIRSINVVVLVTSFTKLRVANLFAFMGSSAYALPATSTTCHICRYLTTLYLPVMRFVTYLLFLVHSLCARVRLPLHWGQVWTSSSSLSAYFFVISRFLSSLLAHSQYTYPHSVVIIRILLTCCL